MATVDLRPTELNVPIAKGDTLDLTVNLVTSAGSTADTTGFTGSGKAIGVFSGNETALTITSPTTSSVKIALTPAQVAALDEVSEYLVEFTDGTDITTAVYGVLSHDPTIN